ncbi:DUF116 domain-containing protein [Planctomycetales bacterium ZRK34]|nr:DUF116 domain-containing protein [Planctomycetales bacterium ZRK34]
MPLNIPLMTIPSTIPPQKMRPAQSNVPPTLAEREQIKRVCTEYVQSGSVVPPVPQSELREFAGKMLAEADISESFIEYAAVLLNNQLWHEHLAGVPFERRLLLLPKCLRAEDTCPAPFDEFGLLCKSCGQCSLQELQAEAERLGYAVLIAEGSALVMAIIETGKIDAIVGVSCLSVLEKAFPYMESAAIPGVAIPLLQDDCRETNVDMEWLWDVIHLTSEDRSYRMDLGGLRKQVATWFEPDELARLCGPAKTDAEQIARQWLARDGKRWRPFLTACAAAAITDDLETPPSDDLKRLAIAVECFHKASLIHDDIEDGDLTRYDQPTVHAEHGVAAAINIGDLLLGEGYRLIGELDAAPDRVAKMLQIAATGHRDLCLGQGAELSWRANPQPLAPAQVLEIFRLKTAPAFEVALRLGATFAGADQAAQDVLHEFSENLGIAYQIRDDIEDTFGGEGTSDIEAMRPTLIPAIAHAMAGGEDKSAVRQWWMREQADASTEHPLHETLRSVGVQERARHLLDAYKEQAIRCLRPLEQPTLKGLLRRVMTKIFNDLKIEGWCSEHEASNASGGEARDEATG